MRWASAFPVRAAETKLGEMDVAAGLNDFYAIAVHDLRPPFRWNLAKELRGVAFLKLGNRKDLKPSRVLVVPRANGLATLVYLFPRSVEITKKDRSLLFVAQVGRLFISTKFIPEEMWLQGQLQL